MRTSPETELIAITCADQTVAILAFVTIEYNMKGVPRAVHDPTDAAITAEIARASSSFDPEKRPVKSWRRIARQEIPADRIYRDALRDVKRKLVHDMSTAREIHRSLLRAERGRIFPDLDGTFMRAQDTDDHAAATKVSRARKRLRELPNDPRIDAAKTIEDLKALWPKDFPPLD